ncbi:MAG: hypothetical protein V2I57_12700 [Xanthomonadales bacterium]|jgi:hypothetical protein|nr:hypothetical protein [Xanthomonadales bacterium]
MSGIANDTRPAAPGWFKFLAIIGLLWNLLGVLSYLFYTVLIDKMMTPEVLDAMPEADRANVEAQLELLASTPAWATGAYAIAVFGGLLGCILMLMRRNLAVPVLGLSLGGVLVQNAHNFMMANTLEVMGPTSLILPSVVLLFAILLLFAAIKAKNEGWSR